MYLLFPSPPSPLTTNATTVPVLRVLPVPVTTLPRCLRPPVRAGGQGAHEGGAAGALGVERGGGVDGMGRHVGGTRSP